MLLVNHNALSCVRKHRGMIYRKVTKVDPKFSYAILFMHMCEIMQRCFYALNDAQNLYRIKLYRIKSKRFHCVLYAEHEQMAYHSLYPFQHKEYEDIPSITIQSLLNAFENNFTYYNMSCVHYTQKIFIVRHLLYALKHKNIEYKVYLLSPPVITTKRKQYTEQILYTPSYTNLIPPVTRSALSNPNMFSTVGIVYDIIDKHLSMLLFSSTDTLNKIFYFYKVYYSKAGEVHVMSQKPYFLNEVTENLKDPDVLKKYYYWYPDTVMEFLIEFYKKIIKKAINRSLLNNKHSHLSFTLYLVKVIQAYNIYFFELALYMSQEGNIEDTVYYFLQHIGVQNSGFTYVYYDTSDYMQRCYINFYVAYYGGK